MTNPNEIDARIVDAALDAFRHATPAMKSGGPFYNLIKAPVAMLSAQNRFLLRRTMAKALAAAVDEGEAIKRAHEASRGA